MSVLLARPSIGSFTGVGHYSVRSVPRDVRDVPPGVEGPQTSILWDWDGTSDSPAGPGAFSTGAERCEKAVGGGPYVEGGVYGWDVWLKFDPVTVNPRGASWNYLYQHRSNGSKPSPCPALQVDGTDLMLRLNIVGYGDQRFKVGELREGQGYHHLEFLYRWSIRASVGWVAARFDGVETLPKRFARTAYDTASGATVRWGNYRDPNVSGPVRYWMWNARMIDAFGSAGAPPAEPRVVTDTTPPTVLITSPAAGQVVRGDLRLVGNYTDASGVKSVQHRVVSADGAAVHDVTETAAPFDDADDFTRIDTTRWDDGAYVYEVTVTPSAGPLGVARVSFAVDNVADEPTPPADRLDPSEEASLEADLRAISERLSGVEGWANLTDVQRASVTAARARAELALTRFGAAAG